MKINSRILFALCAICFFAFESNAKRVEVFRKGSDDSVHYDRVQESHTLFADKLSCTEPGSTLYGWTTPPTIGGHSAEDIEGWVMDEIAKGNKNGEATFNGTVFVKWTTKGGAIRIVMSDEI